MTAAQLKPVLAAIESFASLVPLAEFEAQERDVEGMQGEANGAAAELGVRAEFIDNDWWSVVIPGDQIANIYD